MHAFLKELLTIFEHVPFLAFLYVLVAFLFAKSLHATRQNDRFAPAYRGVGMLIGIVFIVWFVVLWCIRPWG